jgi:hypothetical protein
MKNEFLPYDRALKLKELGFDEPCIATHGYLELYINTDDGHLKAPLYQQAFRWFRGKYKIISVIDFTCDGDNWEDVEYNVKLSEIEHFKTHDTFVGHGYKTYEEAELACLDKMIEIVESKQNK